MDESLVKDVMTVGAPFIKSIVETFVAPKLEKLKQHTSLNINKYFVPTESHFREYFFRTYKKISIINTLVLIIRKDF